MGHLDTVQMAELVGVAPRRLLQIARKRSVAPARRVGRNCLWDGADAGRLTPGKHGWPKGKKRGRRALANGGGEG